VPGEDGLEESGDGVFVGDVDLVPFERGGVGGGGGFQGLEFFLFSVGDDDPGGFFEQGQGDGAA
jgi:hypothetical protein